MKQTEQARQAERESDRIRAMGYTVKLGSNLNDEKTQAAYKRFKTPLWYLRNKNVSGEEKTNDDTE